jgi:hypothetical protein
MKSLAWLLTFTFATLAPLAPAPVSAQHLPVSPGIVRIPLGGFHSTTIYTPSPNNVTTNVTTKIGIGDDLFFNRTGNDYRHPAAYPNTRPQYPIVINPQPIAIYQQPTIQPRATLTRCVLKTLNDPQQSLVAVDRYTGKPCD